MGWGDETALLAILSGMIVTVAWKVLDRRGRPGTQRKRGGA